jgi:hypothetical protein
MTYTSSIEITADDGAVRRYRVVWVEEPHFNVLSKMREHDSSTWRPLNVFDSDTGEALDQISSGRFRSSSLDLRVTIRPKVTLPGGRP